MSDSPKEVVAKAFLGVFDKARGPRSGDFDAMITDYLGTLEQDIIDEKFGGSREKAQQYIGATMMFDGLKRLIHEHGKEVVTAYAEGVADGTELAQDGQEVGDE